MAVTILGFTHRQWAALQWLNESDEPKDIYWTGLNRVTGAPLIDAGLIKHNGKRRGRLFTITDKGREKLAELDALKMD